MVYFLCFYLGASLLRVRLANGDDLAVSTPRLLRSNAAQSTYLQMISTIAHEPLAAISKVDQYRPNQNKAMDTFNAMREALEATVTEALMSFNPSEVPTSMPSDSVSGSPSEVLSSAPSSTFSAVPSDIPSSVPSSTTDAPTGVPVIQTPSPVTPPMIVPVIPPVDTPIAAPVTATSSPVATPTTTTTASPVEIPTVTTCPGISEEERISQILDILDSVADPNEIRDNNTPQGLATTWIIAQDSYDICPDNPKLVQRWTLAVMYFSTNGDQWFQCSADPDANDACGAESPFEGKQRFLSNIQECEWAGISCINDCVTEIEYEENNLIGTIPTEMGLLTMLTVWGMERGQLQSTIPTEIGKLTNLIFIDFDFNRLSGSLTTELLSLSSLTQLDLNNNLLTGSINGIGVFPNMTFLQIHANAFTGTVPEAVGTFKDLGAFTLHESFISGTMPQSVCNLRPQAGDGGKLTSLIADCSAPNPNVICACCSDCRRAQAS